MLQDMPKVGNVESGSTYPYVEDATGKFEGQIDYRVNCGFQPNYVFIVGTMNNAIGDFIRGYYNGSYKEGWTGIGWRTSSYMSVTTDANGCTVKFTDTGWSASSFTKCIIVCA